MKHVVFQSLVVDSFREASGVVIDYEAMGQGLHYVTGRNRVNKRLGANGVGKSTLFADALSWVLTGKTTRGLRGSDVRPWQRPKEHARVSIVVRVAGKAHTITRSTVTNGLWINERVSAQDDVTSLLGFNETNIPFTLIFGQATPMFLDLTASAKMSVLSETLNLDRFDDYSKSAKDKVAKIDAKIADLENQRSSTMGQIETSRERLATVREKAVSWQTVNADTITATKTELTRQEKRREELIVEKGRADLDYDAAETEARAARNEHQSIADEITRVAGIVGGLRGALETALKQKHEIETAPDCPVCGRPMDKKHAKRESEGLRTSSANLQKKIDEHTAELDKLEKKAERISKSVRSFRKKADDAKDAYLRTAEALAVLDADVKRLRDAINEAEKPNPYTSLVQEYRADIDKLKASLVVLNNRTKAATARRERFHYWIDGFKRVRLHLLEEFLAEVEALTLMMLPASGLIGWQVQFRLEKELRSGESRMGLDIRCMKSGVEVVPKWESWSGGEGQRLRLVASRALAEALKRRMGVRCDLVVFDEPTRHLSREGVADVVDMLADMADDGHQIVYIDHQAVESVRFTSVLRVIKRSDSIRVAADAV